MPEQWTCTHDPKCTDLSEHERLAYRAFWHRLLGFKVTTDRENGSER